MLLKHVHHVALLVSDYPRSRAFYVEKLGLPIRVPENYFPDDDDTKPPLVRWRGHGNLLFSNWLNYFVYQTTPYDIMTIGPDTEFSEENS